MTVAALVPTAVAFADVTFNVVFRVEAEANILAAVVIRKSVLAVLALAPELLTAARYADTIGSLHFRLHPHRPHRVHG
jgi:hypothetical protein